MNYFAVPGLKKTHPQLALMDSLTKYVASSHATNTEEIKGRSRKEHIKTSRHICMYMLKKCKKITFEHIGNYYNRDHATVIHAVKTITNDMEYDHYLRNYIKELKERFDLEELKPKK